jgi:hypothetical protein
MAISVLEGLQIIPHLAARELLSACPGARPLLRPSAPRDDHNAVLTYDLTDLDI